MKNLLLLAALSATLGLTACDRPTVVNTPPNSTVAVPVAVPGPAGPQGDPGKPGTPGSTNIVVMPQAASEPR